MTCKPLLLGLDVAGNEVIYPTSQTTAACSPAILDHYIDLGFNIFRVLISWERLQPALAESLTSTTPSITPIPLDADYASLLQAFVQKCSDAKVYCILQLVNGGWYDSQYNPSYTNDGTTSCPSSGFVYINQPATTIDGVTVIGPTTGQFSNLWQLIANLDGISQNPYVRFGLGTNPTIGDTDWATICNTVISNLRASSIQNICHVDLMNSAITSINDYDLFTDPSIVLNINYYDDDNNGMGTSVQSSDDYVACAIAAKSLLQNVASNCSVKLSFGDVRFDSGALSLLALPKFLSYLRDNIDVYDSVCLYAIGGGINLPECYNLNQVTVNNVTSDVPQITIAEGYTTSYEVSGIYSALTVNLTTDPITYVPGSPFGNSYQSLSSGQLFLPFSIFSTGVQSVTVECWINFILGATTNLAGYIFGSQDTFSATITASTLTFSYGADSYIEFDTTNTLIDGNWHHLELGIDNTGVYCFVDGKLLGKSILKQSFDYNPTHGTLCGIRSNGKVIGDTNPAISANISNFVVWNKLLHSSDFTPPTNYYSGLESDLVANFPLNGDIDCWM